MKIISINIQEPYYSFLLKGEKTIEGRLNKDKFTSLDINDILEINPEKIKFKIIRKNIYPDFKTMLKKEKIKNILPDKKTITESLRVYYKYYSKEEEKHLGVVIFELEKIKK